MGLSPLTGGRTVVCSFRKCSYRATVVRSPLVSRDSSTLPHHSLELPQSCQKVQRSLGELLMGHAFFVTTNPAPLGSLDPE